MSIYRKIKIAGRTMSLHKYVYEQAHGPVPEGYVVHHVNHNKLDNRVKNLTLMTHEEHSRHHNDRWPREKMCVMCHESFEPAPTKRKRAQTCSRSCMRALQALKAQDNPQTRPKLSQEQEADILARLAAGETGKALAVTYGVAPSTISRIRNRKD